LSASAAIKCGHMLTIQSISKSQPRVASTLDACSTARRLFHSTVCRRLLHRHPSPIAAPLQQALQAERRQRVKLLPCELRYNKNGPCRICVCSAGTDGASQVQNANLTHLTRASGHSLQGLKGFLILSREAVALVPCACALPRCSAKRLCPTFPARLLALLRVMLALAHTNIHACSHAASQCIHPRDPKSLPRHTAALIIPSPYYPYYPYYPKSLPRHTAALSLRIAVSCCCMRS